MRRTDGHQLVVNDYYVECLRKAKETEDERNDAIKRVQDRDAVAAGPTEGTARRRDA